MLIVYHTATGQAVSFGTVVANPLPAGLSVFPVPVADRDGLRDGSKRWDASTRTIVVVPPDPSVVADTDLRGKVRTALTANAAYLGLPSPTNAQTVAHVQRLTRECSALIRLLIGADLLTENTDT